MQQNSHEELKEREWNNDFFFVLLATQAVSYEMTGVNKTQQFGLFFVF